MIGSRIKELRKALKLTQEEIGRVIGITGAGVSRIESGLSRPTEAAIRLICSTYNVNYTWLTTGEGEMFVSKTDTVGQLVQQYGFPEICDKLLRAFDQLPPEGQDAVLTYARAFIAEMIREDAAEKVEEIQMSPQERAARDHIARRAEEERARRSSTLWNGGNGSEAKQA